MEALERLIHGNDVSLCLINIINHNKTKTSIK